MRKSIITISREFGSGGLDIGRIISNRLGIPFYDKELISITAKESGLALDYIKENGEYGKNSLLFNIVISSGFGTPAFSYNNISAPDKIYIMQNNIIKQIAEKGPCVIMGRCSDYILRDRDDVLNVFIYSSSIDFKKEILKDAGVELSDKEILKKDKNRATNYKRYTSKEWGKASNYHLSLDTSVFGIERCAEMILDALK